MADELKPPEKRITDHLYTAGKVATGMLAASLSGLPLLKLPAETLFGILVADPGQKRSRQFFEDVCNWLELLASQNRVTMEVLQNHQEFISALRGGMVAATTTHHREKLDALRNTVLNIAVGPDEDDPERQVFLSHIQQLGAWHLRYLKFFASPRSCPPGTHWGPNAPNRWPISHLLTEVYPGTKLHRDTSVAIVDELCRLGLMRVPDSRIADLTEVADGYMTPKLTTAFGDKLLSFIIEPPERNS
ncbi:hypothetical protein Pan44_28340 [Caulifigura coniformis]|uniref:Uncharacterized protein n=1 Tax=Caulifigura coniformis TaxID=2527983 RepID=A0A517SF88_9PLAN|nr:hypothetical protein [Caulifigura coniformis]QDT54796.1 hypothetical protein Pan44_28340 [Caulifigura coniformis]